MTDNTGIRPSLRKDPDRPALTHKSSFSRSIVTPPETSPPSQELPPVPSLNSFSSLPNSDKSPSDPGSSSSSLSFAPSFESDPLAKNVCVEDTRLRSVRDQAKLPSERSPTRALRGALNPTPSKQPATSDGRGISLKKMPSQPSLQKPAGSLSAYPGDQPLDVDDVFGPTKLVKKQRSFHHNRVPVPPLPYMRHTPSFPPSEGSVSQPSESPKHKEKEKRESAASLSKRRFLPGSIRRGSSQMATFTFDDDTGSIVIPSTELDRSEKSPPPRLSNLFGSPGVTSMMLPATSAFYDDLAGSPTTGSHFPHSTEVQPQDPGPQQILSSAQLLRLEEMLEMDDSDVSTDFSSRTSPAELGSPDDLSPTDPPPFEEFGFGNGHRSPKKKDSWTDSITSSSTIFSSALSEKNIFPDRVETGSTLSFFDQQQHPGYRPRTTSGSLPPLDSSFSMKRSHSAFASSSHSIISMGIESTFGIEPNQPVGGLSPPPRRRPKVSTGSKSSNSAGSRESMVHIQPLSPPPLRRNTTSTSASSRSTSTRSSPISSPKSPPSAFKSDLPTRAIMKKPSFLEIEDDPEVDAETRVRVVVGGDIHQRNTSISSIDDSFLDLGRENNSFDTIRTLSVEGPG